MLDSVRRKAHTVSMPRNFINVLNDNLSLDQKVHVLNALIDTAVVQSAVSTEQVDEIITPAVLFDALLIPVVL